MMASTQTKEQTSPLLEATNLVKRFSTRRSWTERTTITALSNFSFQVRAGETLAIVGESGCGKSTAGKIILGLIKPDEGLVRFQGDDLSEILAHSQKRYRRAVQIVFQNPLTAFNPMLTLQDALLDAMRLRDDLDSAQRRAESVRLMELVGLDADHLRRYPSEMSGGQLQRVGIARALASDPKIIFLDEPTSALDMSIRGQIVNLLLDLQAQFDLTYILVSHDMSVVRAMAHRVIVLYMGEAVEEGTVDQVLQHPLHPYTQALVSAARLGLAEDGTSRLHQVRGEALHLESSYLGCKLTRRCPYELPRCREETQHLLEIEPGHLVRCWRAQERSLPDIS